MGVMGAAGRVGSYRISTVGREMKLEALDQDVYRLALAGYVGREIQDLLDVREEALQASLDRLAEWLAPTAASRSIDPADCVPFNEW